MPSASFQQIARHLRKFHEGLSGVLSDEQLKVSGEGDRTGEGDLGMSERREEGVQEHP